MPSSNSGNRRDFLTGKTALDGIRDRVEDVTSQVAPTAGHTVRMAQRAMACDFAVIQNAGVPKRRIREASQALDLIGELEQQLSVYKSDSELSEINRLASQQPVEIESQLFALLVEAKRVSERTGGAFDPTSGPLVALWRECREQSRIPTQEEIETCLERVGMHHVQLSASGTDGSESAAPTIRYDRPEVELNLGAIGKGYALDRTANLLLAGGVKDYLVHGGHSSIYAHGDHTHGDHNGLGGWPVGIGNPLFTSKRLGTLVLRDQGMGTSGSNIQYFRHQGKKYGHILDPRTGWPVESMLSVTVLAPTAAMADALSTAFYVMGVEKVLECCDNLEGVGVILIPTPSGRDLRPIVHGIPEEKLFLDQSQLGN